MGHVPAGPVPQEGARAHLPRRQRGRGRASRSRAAYRRLVGDLGEQAAAVFLSRRGCRIVGRNVRAGRGEIDLLILDRGALVAVEVKAGADPRIHFTPDKADAVREAMRRLTPAPRRLDLVTVETGATAATIRWHRGVG